MEIEHIRDTKNTVASGPIAGGRPRSSRLTRRYPEAPRYWPHYHCAS